MTDQLAKLVKRFPPALIQPPARGKRGDYIAHPVITQRLLEVVGPFDLTVVREIRDELYQWTTKDKDDNVTHHELPNLVTGVVVELSCTVDGQTVTIQEVGECEHPGNKDTNGERLKNAISDGVKRCAMRLGVGLQLWAQDDYYIDRTIKAAEAGTGAEDDRVEPVVPAPISEADADVLVALIAEIPGSLGGLTTAFRAKFGAAPRDIAADQYAEARGWLTAAKANREEATEVPDERSVQEELGGSEGQVVDESSSGLSRAREALAKDAL